LRIDHPVYDFVDGSIATRGKNQVGVLPDALFRDRSGCARACCGYGPDAVTVPLQDFEGAPQNPLTVADQLSRIRVIDQENFAISRDGFDPPLSIPYSL
jgi:hypothetical protein